MKPHKKPAKLKPSPPTAPPCGPNCWKHSQAAAAAAAAAPSATGAADPAAAAAGKAPVQQSPAQQQGAARGGPASGSGSSAAAVKAEPAPLGQTGAKPAGTQAAEVIDLLDSDSDMEEPQSKKAKVAAAAPGSSSQAGTSKAAGGAAVASGSGAGKPVAAAQPQAQAAGGSSKKAAAAGSGSAATPAWAANPKPWSELEETLLAKALTILGEEPCRLASLLGSRCCAEIKAVLDGRNGGSAAAASAAASEEGAGGRRAGKGGRGKAKQTAIQARRKQSAVVRKRLEHDCEVWPEYQPCQCVGNCNSACPCAASKNFCEKFCACSCSTCANRFRGCVCKGGCHTRTCPCRAAGRECDPDLCKQCAKVCEGVTTPDQHGHVCHNMQMRLRQHTRVALGISTVAGWGAFMGTKDAVKGWFFCSRLNRFSCMHAVVLECAGPGRAARANELLFN